MKNYSQALIDEKKKQNVTTFWLVKISTYCYTDCNQAIAYNGDTYNPWPLQLNGMQSSDGSPLDAVTIGLGNANLELSSIVLNSLFKNADVFINEAWLDANNTIIAADLVFAGKVDGRPALNEMWATVTAAPHINPWTQGFPRRRITKKLFPFLPSRGDKFTWGQTIITIK